MIGGFLVLILSNKIELNGEDRMEYKRLIKYLKSLTRRGKLEIEH